jgi:hypothetical protein
MLAPETMRILLVITMLGISLIGARYLFRRKLSLTGYLWWGALLLFPILGPILLIAAAPGTSRAPARQIRRATAR